MLITQQVIALFMNQLSRVFSRAFKSPVSALTRISRSFIVVLLFKKKRIKINERRNKKKEWSYEKKIRNKLINSFIVIDNHNLVSSSGVNGAMSYFKCSIFIINKKCIITSDVCIIYRKHLQHNCYIIFNLLYIIVFI